MGKKKSIEENDGQENNILFCFVNVAGRMASLIISGSSETKAR